MSDAYPEYIEEFSIEISDFNPIGPTAHIALSETLPKHNNGIINIQNDDDWCFGWSVLGALHPVKVHPERNPHRLYGGFVEELNMDDIPVPVPVSTPVYEKFEENNLEIKIRYNEHLPKCKGLNNAPQQPQMPVKNRTPEIVQKLEEAKHILLEIKEWETCIEKEHPKKKEAQKEYSKALNALNRKVKDHDHISGKFRGPAHDACNKSCG
ncbi:hypothetical protein GLOIN_2v1882929 [Rhizophagus clarus]|uniref:Uncharacterized protein n=1 Tax=Rhizophagus clarus TaxID=94130 RepID=A0A8H3LW27_9GLOM|nr:hypothetical protein GLOIN_2v1882929 [Rhizophagus clarus]